MPAPAFLSRHFLSEQPSSICIVPFAPGAPDQGGQFVTNNLVALGAWNEEAQEHHLTLISLVTGHTGGAVASQPCLTRLAGFTQPTKVVAVQAKSLTNSHAVLVSAGSDGSLCRLRMQIPTVPGSRPETIQLQEDDMDGAALQPWTEAQQGSITALDINTDTCEVVSTARCGSIALTHLEASNGGSEENSGLYFQSGGTVELTCCRWASQHTFVTGSMAGDAGVLQTWDRRQKGQAVQKCSSSDTSFTCMSIHPAQHHICATGSNSGMIAVWDLRQGKMPISSFVAMDENDCLNDVQFDVASDNPKLIFCTRGGVMGTAHDNGDTRCLYREPSASIEGLCMNTAGTCRQLFAVTDQEALVYMANVL